MPLETIAPLFTERLTLRPLSRSDAAALHRFRGDPDATRFLSHQALTAEANYRRLEERLAQAEASTSEWYVLHPDHHRQGYGREAAGALVAWHFGARGISTVFAGVYEPNIASVRLLRSLGFAQDRHFPTEQDKTGKGLPSLWFRLDGPTLSSS